MAKTISFHNGVTWSRGHNIRDERYTGKQAHIDGRITEQNVVIRDKSVREAYEEIFGEAVAEYNGKQKRGDRRIQDYYEKIKKDKRKHVVYECIVQIGDREDTGNTAEAEKKALERYAREWDKRNPNLRMIGAYIHCDEPEGTVHLHIDYIPVADCTRGMRKQNSLDRALQQQGYTTENIHRTAQIAWQDREREAICEICREMNIDAQRNQGIGQGRSYLSPQEYKRAQEKVEVALKPLKDELEKYLELQPTAVETPLGRKKLPFGIVTVSEEALEKIEEQAKAYRVNRREIEEIRERKAAVEKREEESAEKEKELQEREEKIKKGQQQVRAMYERQKNLNQILERAERENKALREERSRLQKMVEEQEGRIEKLKRSLKRVIQAMTDIVKAVKMLKYDKTEGYRVEQLTEEQGILIDGIVEYGKKVANGEGSPDSAKNMESQIGISTEIGYEVLDLTPDYLNSYGGMTL